ncbi:MAG: pilus assembly protein PilM [Deltaproteobacteria bacterium]
MKMRSSSPGPRRAGKAWFGPRLFPGGGGRDVVCFDFVTDAIKAARVKTFGGRRIVTEVDYRDIRGASREETVVLLRDLLVHHRRRGDFQLVLTLSSPFLITKNIEIPSQDSKEIKDIINLQAGRLTPYAREEVIIDYVNIGVFRQSYTKLLLAIVNKDIVNRQFALFGEAGGRVEKVFFGSEAIGALIYQHVRLEVQETPFALIHVDAAATDFGVFLKGKLIFSRSIAVGARPLLTEREKHVGRYIDELRKSLDAYHLEDIEVAPTLVVVCGAVGRLRDLEVMMLDAFRIPVRFLEAADVLVKGDNVDRGALAMEEVSVWDVAAPAGLPAGVNLVPEEMKLRQALEERGRDIFQTGILAFLTLLFVFASFLVSIYLKAEYLGKLNAKFKNLNAEAATIEKDFSRVRVIRTYLEHRGYLLNILAEIYRLTPAEVGIVNINLRETGTFSVKGEAASMAVVFAYVGDLEKSDMFKEVKTRYTSKKKVEGQELVDFELSGVLEAGAEVPS